MIRLPQHQSLLIQHNSHVSEGETVSYWLEQLQPEPSDFPSEEAQLRAVMTGELWALQWQDAGGLHFLLAPTFDELMHFAQERFCRQMINFA